MISESKERSREVDEMRIGEIKLKCPSVKAQTHREAAGRMSEPRAALPASLSPTNSGTGSPLTGGDQRLAVWPVFRGFCNWKKKEGQMKAKQKEGKATKVVHEGDGHWE